jgi:hypothetical protein
MRCGGQLGKTALKSIMDFDKKLFIEQARTGQLDKVRASLAAYAKETKNDGQAMAAMAGAALIAAAQKNQSPVVKFLVPMAVPTHVDNALNIAASAGALNSVKALIASKQPHWNNLSTSTFFLYAIANGHRDVVQSLLSVFEATNPQILTMAAQASSHSSEIVALLISQSSPKHNNSAALRMAAERLNLPVMKLLLPLSDVEAAAKFLAKTAREDQADKTSAWSGLDQLACMVPVIQAKKWVKKYGIEHFPQFQAMERSNKTLKNEFVFETVRKRCRP